MSSGWYYKPGDYYQIDDMSGFKIRASRSRRIPGGQTGGLVVAPERYEEQHPQDFVRGVIDEQTVPQPRPRQPNRFVIVATFVTAYSPRLSRVVQVDTTEGFTDGHKVTVMLDNGEPYYPTIIRIAGNLFTFTPRLPYSVGGNIGDPIENTIVDLGPSDAVPFLVDDAGPFIMDDGGNYFSLP